MSSGKTETLGLNQWQLSDAFRMEEFNKDNRKIDAVVSLLPYRELMSVTTSAAAQTVELDLSGLDLRGIVEMDIYCADPGNSAYYTNMRINGLSAMENYQSYSSYYNNWSANAIYLPSGTGVFRLMFCYTGIFVETRSLSGSHTVYKIAPDMAVTAIRKLTFTRDNSQQYSANTKFLITGVKQ